MRRTNEAFAAEVYRRGKATIEGNKKRRQALLATLPVAVCLLAVSVAVLPGLLPGKTTGLVSATSDALSSAEDVYGGDEYITGDSMPAPFLPEDGASTQGGFVGMADDAQNGSVATQSIEVLWSDGKDDQSRLCTDSATIAALESRLPPEAVAAALLGNKDVGAIKGESVDADSKNAPPLYRLTVTKEDGNRYSYSLMEGRLYVENADLWLSLTEEEAAALQDALRQCLSGE